MCTSIMMVVSWVCACPDSSNCIHQVCEDFVCQLHLDKTVKKIDQTMESRFRLQGHSDLQVHCGRRNFALDRYNESLLVHA